MVALNLGTSEPESAGESLRSRPARSPERVPGQLGLKDILLQKDINYLKIGTVFLWGEDW